MKKYFHVHFVRIYGAYVHIHWSVFAVAAVFLAYAYKVPLSAASYIIAYFGMILLHEAGHAYFAKRMGYKPLDIYLSALHGSCLFHQPNSYKDECIIAWGGVIAQLIVATPLILLMLTTSLVRSDILDPILLTLGPLKCNYCFSEPHSQ